MIFRNCIRAVVMLTLALVTVTATNVGASAAPARTADNALAAKGTSAQTSAQTSPRILCFVATIAPKKNGSQMTGFASTTCSSPVRLIEMRTVLLDQANNIVADTGTKPFPNTNRAENPVNTSCRTGLYRTVAVVFIEFGSGDPPTAQGTFSSEYAGVVC
jgi:hypothetical protein